MHPDLRSIRGIFFDLWNTLAYSASEPHPMILIAEALGIHGRPGWRKILERGMMRRPFLGIREALAGLEEESGRRIGPPGRRDCLVRQWNEACAATRLYEDALPALLELRGRFRLGVLSNTQSFDLDFLGSRGLLPILDVLCLSCHEGRLKPDPALFASAARRMGLPPAAVLMVGDSLEDDVAGSIAAGMRAVHLARGGPASGAGGATASIGSLTGLSFLLSRESSGPV